VEEQLRTGEGDSFQGGNTPAIDGLEIIPYEALWDQVCRVFLKK